jgi:hypothetical protein
MYFSVGSETGATNLTSGSSNTRSIGADLAKTNNIYVVMNPMRIPVIKYFMVLVSFAFFAFSSERKLTFHFVLPVSAGTVDYTGRSIIRQLVAYVNGALNYGLFVDIDKHNKHNQ